MSPVIKEKPADRILVIEKSAKQYADSRHELAGMIDLYNADLKAVQDKHLKMLRAQTAVTAVRRAVLESDVEAAPDLFVKPRTITLHGIRLGYKKGTGKVVFADEEKLVERIQAQFPKAQARSLLNVKTTPLLEAIALLPGDQLKKLGVSIQAAGDAVYIKAVDTDFEKMANQICAMAAEATQS